MTENKKNIAVIFLWWIPQKNKEEHRSFFASYKKYSAGIDYQFYVLIKDGTASENTLAEKYLSENDIVCKKIFYKGGFDIDAFYYGAGQVSEKYVLFLNTGTKLTSDNWLKSMVNAFYQDSEIALVGSSGSFQSMYTSVFINFPWQIEKNRSLAYHFRKYKLLIKNIFYWRFLFDDFPNPHIRTNGFMVCREIFLQVKKEKFRNKFDTYLFESGKNSISKQIVKMGYKIAVADKYGNYYFSNDWERSNTFYHSGDSTCIISDKQTELYEKAEEKDKFRMRQLAWGRKKSE